MQFWFNFYKKIIKMHIIHKQESTLRKQKLVYQYKHFDVKNLICLESMLYLSNMKHATKQRFNTQTLSSITTN